MATATPLDPWAHRQRAAFLRMAPLMESPAEALLLPALLALGGPDAHVLGPAGRWALDAQVTVPTGGRAYRVDFAATRGEDRVAVEVDGWANHHASEAHEAYDACRDWAMGERGWVVVRLEAWRVFQSPTAAAEIVGAALREVEIGNLLPAGPKPPAPDQDIIDRLSGGGLSADEEDALLRELSQRAMARRGKGEL